MKWAWLVVLSGLQPLCGQAISPAPPHYASFVCWDYPHLPQLKAWRETEKIIAAALSESYPAFQPLARQQNGTPAALTQLLTKLPGEAGGVTLVYLAAHQSPGGQWYFPDGSVPSWSTLTNDLPELKNRQRLVFFDCCYAESATLYPGWQQKAAPAVIYASAATEPTPDLYVYRRRPIDAATYFPQAVAWLKQHGFRDSDEKVSFFGLCWLEAWLAQPTPPQTWDQWRAFATAVTQTGQRVAPQLRSGEGSTLVLSFPP